MKIYIKMFSKYFLLLAGLFLLDHGRSSHLLPSKIKNVFPSPPPIARQLTWLGSQQESSAALSRAGVCRWDSAVRVPDGFLVFNCVCVPVSHLAKTSGFSLCLLSYLLHGTRRTSSPHSCLLDGRVSCPVSCALCRKNYFAWHVSTPPRRMIFFLRNLEPTSPSLSESVSRASSPGESLGDL